MRYYRFDGSYTGYLVAFFEHFERREWDAVPLTRDDTIIAALFNDIREIESDVDRAERIVRGLHQRLGKIANKDFYRLFLSEDRRAWKIGFQLMRKIFQGEPQILQNFRLEEVHYFHKVLKQVGREAHRMQAFVRFSKDRNNLYLAQIEPDYNVLPLVSEFFRKRFADQAWLIFDVKRSYGIHYDSRTVQEVALDLAEVGDLETDALNLALNEGDANYQALWKRYFQSTTIPARKNMKLHLRHVPKRYWKYLPEKQSEL